MIQLRQLKVMHQVRNQRQILAWRYQRNRKSNSNSDIGEIADQGGVVEIPGENELVTFTHPREKRGLEEEEEDPLVPQKVSR